MSTRMKGWIKPSKPEHEDEGFGITYETHSPDTIFIRFDTDGETYASGYFRADEFDKIVNEYLAVRKLAPRVLRNAEEM